MADLKRKSVRGGAVTLISQAISIAIQLTSTVVLARLLSPGDYGVMAMVMAVTGFAGLFRDLGLSSAAIQKKELTRAQQSNLFWLNVAMGLLLTVIVAAASPMVAWFYGKPELTVVTLTLSASFLIGSFGTQHGAMLVRNMLFARQAVANISGAFFGLAVSVALAFQGYSYWALVWGSLVGGLATTLLLLVISPFRPGLPHLGSGIREMLKFGANVTAYDFVNYFARNLDNILIGKLSGPLALGLYSRAYSLLMLPIASLRGPINAVGFPALSRLQDNPTEYRAYYCRITSFLAIASMALIGFLFTASGPIIGIALGPQWSGIIPLFEILAAVSFIQPTLTLWGMVLLSLGLGRRYFFLGIFNTLVIVAGFLCGLRWGASGVATGYAVATYATIYPTLEWAFRNTPLKVRDFTSSVYRPFVAGITSALCSRMSMIHFGIESDWMKLLSSAMIFFFCYLLVLLLLPGGRTQLQDVASMWHVIAGRRSRPLPNS